MTDMRVPLSIDAWSDASQTDVTEAKSSASNVETRFWERVGDFDENRAAQMHPGQYRPEIDGLRAIAVLAVLLFHADGLIPGGFTGVDVFFVISGFLITGLICKELEAGTFRLANFWQRRIRRIFPAQAVLVITVLAFGVLLLLPQDFYELCSSALAQSVFLSNVYFWLGTGYFGASSGVRPLLHMWSLAVEEQFYLAFPLFLLACKRLRRSTLAVIISLLAISSFALSVWGSAVHPHATFFLLPTRAWELLTGSLLTFAPRAQRAMRSRSWLGEIGSAIGLVLIVAACALFDERTRFPGAAALLPCGGSALIIYFNRSRRTLVGNLLASRPLVSVGLISYSLYLWHWAIFAFCYHLNDEVLDGWLCVSAVGGSCVAGYLSWKYVETPFRRGASGASAAQVFSAALVVSVLIVAVSAVGWKTRGLPARFSKEVQNLAAESGQPNRFLTTDVVEVIAGKLPVLGDLSPTNAHPCFLLWGDSHAMMTSELVDRLARKYSVAGYAACHLGTLPVLETSSHGPKIEPRAWNRAVVDFVRKAEIRNVILVARWSAYVEGEDTRIDDTPSKAKQALRTGIERTIDELRRAGCRVWIIKQVPEQPINTSRSLMLAEYLPWRSKPKGVSLDDHRRRQANVNDVLIACEASDVRVWDPEETCFDREGHSRIVGDGRSYYSDRHHLSPFGAEALLSGFLDRWFAEIAADCGAGSKGGE